MKVFSSLCVSFFVVATVLAESSIENVRNSAAELCKKELNVGDDDSNILKTRQLPTNEAQNCFLECIYSKLQLIKDGQLNEEGARALAKQKFGDDREKLAKAEEVFSRCQKEIRLKSEEKCPLGRALRECFLVYGEQIQIFTKTS